MENLENNQVKEVEEDFQMSANIAEISGALASAQGELESANKGNSGYGYNYSDLNTVIATAKPVLSKNNLAIVQLVGKEVDGKVVLTTILSHSSGQWFKTTSALPIVEMKSCNRAQEFGASLSYLRRYTYQAILGMSSEDNDASSKGFNDNPVKKVVMKDTKKELKPTATTGFSKRRKKVQGVEDDL